MLLPIRKLLTPAIPLESLLAGCAPILTYHACYRQPPAEIPPVDNVSPAWLYRQISELKQRIRLVAVDELAASRTLKGVGAVTFDDAYQSVIEEALPVFEALNVPFTIFVNTYPFTGRVFWRHKLMYLLNLGLEKECARAFRGVRRLPGQPLSEALKDPRNNTRFVEEEIDEFLERNGLRPELGPHCLSSPAELVPHRLIWYGNHSHHHRVLASLPAAEQREEIAVTKNYLETIPGIQLSRAVALPFGQVCQANRETLAAVRDCGYDVLLLNRGGVNRTFASVMGVRVLERFSVTEAPLAWNVFREVANTLGGRRSPSFDGLRRAGLTGQAAGPGPRREPAAHMLRILELVNNLDTGGAETMASSLSLELARMGHQVDVACLREFGRMTVPAERFAENGVHLWQCGKRDGWSAPVVWKLARFLKSERIDVIHSHNPLVTHYAAAAAFLAGTPLSVATIHGTNTLALRRGERALFASACRLTDRIVLVCRQVHEEFCRRFPALAGRASAIPNGIEVEELLAVAPRTFSSEFVFGSVGRLAPVKDFHSLLAAFALVYRQIPRCRLEILGSGELQADLESFAAGLGLGQVVTFRGWSPDVAGFLSRVDAFVLSSRSEGLPMSVLEAMAAGLPVVSTAVGGVPELIETANCGWLARPGDPRDLAQKMALAITNRNGHGARGREAVREWYSAGCMARRYSGLFEQCLKSRLRAAS
ncbi:MAG TPA: glycosyltransferase [Bryobacteraceae bacterium]|nr:glycosyltransferase [Bryobacteraceae bacterium]